MTTVLVTGVRGKTGRQIAAALLRRRGVAVRGARRKPDGHEIPGLTLTPFDFADPTSWREALAGVEALYLLRPKTPDPAATIAALLRSPERLRRVVFLSELDAENRAEDTDERKVEQAVRSAGLAWTILRPNWFMQNFTEPSYYLEAIRDSGEIVVPTGGQPTSFVDTRDIADVAAAALVDGGHAGRCYTLTGAQALTWSDAARRMGEAAGHAVRHSDPPLEEYLDALSRNGTAEATVAYYGRIYRSIRDGRTAQISGDVETVTGHPPRSFSAFVEEMSGVWRRSSGSH